MRLREEDINSNSVESLLHSKESDSEPSQNFIEDSSKEDVEEKEEEEFGDICTFCDEPLPAKPSERLNKMKATLSSIAQNNKGVPLLVSVLYLYM